MVLAEELSIMDLIAIAQFGLLPDDDLTLATILKSPLIGLTENELYDLAIDREGSLWKQIRLSAQGNEKISAIHKYLEEIIGDAQSQHPFDFFSSLLFKPCPADNISGKRALIARLVKDI